MNFLLGPENPRNLILCQDKRELLIEIFAHGLKLKVSLTKLTSPLCCYEKNAINDSIMTIFFFYLSISIMRKCSTSSIQYCVS